MEGLDKVTPNALFFTECLNSVTFTIDKTISYFYFYFATFIWNNNLAGLDVQCVMHAYNHMPNDQRALQPYLMVDRHT